MRRTSVRALVLVMVLAAAFAAGPSAAVAATESEGYLELSDGTRLRYTLVLPDGAGPFPVVLQHSGYNNGNNPADGTFGKLTPRLVEEGVAVIGVNLRGSGCSDGTFSPFSTRWAEDGVEVVGWIAEQEWSDGNVAMAGVSYPAILALVTAVERPPALKAIVASVPVVDLYRDVAYPGGAFNATFASVWTVLQKYGTFFGLQEIAEGDVDCATHVPGQNDPTDITGVQAATNPYIDSLDRYTDFLQAADLARIEVPALVHTAWQDEQLGSRAMHAYEHLDPSRSWIVASNGDHIGFSGSAWKQDLDVAFLHHFLRGGAPEDFDHPVVQVAREVRRGDAGFDELDTYDTYPVPTVTSTLHAQPDGSFARSPASEVGGLSYAYPLPAPSVPVGIDVGVGVNPEAYEEAYQLPVPPGGSVAFTTPALAEHLQFHGPGSVDLWFESTGAEVDLQVTLTEVRPDGQELYVQRGWLRGSHRELDEERTRPTRPVQTHLEADAEPLEPGVVTPLRVELWPVDHVFRAGSALRLYVEAPVGMTGFRQLAVAPAPATNTILVGPDTPTRFVFGRIATPSVTTGRPDCGTLLNQPCRPSPSPVPPGSLSFADADADGGAGGDTDGAGAPAPAAGGSGAGAAPLPATGGSAALLGVVTLAAGAALRHGVPSRGPRRRRLY